MFHKCVVGMFKGESDTVCGEIMFHKCVVGMFKGESETLYSLFSTSLWENLRVCTT